jgi:outer membrane immunogenic protein
MRKVWFGSVALAALTLAGAAQAADLTPAVPITKAPPPAAPASSWTGFYAGLGVGFRATRDDMTTRRPEFVDPAIFSQLAASKPIDGTGFRAAPYVGFNWQFAPRGLIGIEGDVGVANQTTTLNGFPATPGQGEDGRDPTDRLSLRATWDASLRGRLGFLVTPATLAYVTGGAAWQHVEINSECGSCAFNGEAPPVVGSSTIRTGWTVGGGLETALWGHWLARAEYRYADFGSEAVDITRVETRPPARTFTRTMDVALRSHIATFGLAYKFGDPIASYDVAGGVFPASAARKPMSWGGVYAGLGLGARASRTDVTTTAVNIGGFSLDLSQFASSEPYDGTGFRVSPYVGYNWQIAPRLVTGVEGDFGFAKQETTLTAFPFSPALDISSASLAADSSSVKSTWDASLRGRLGFLVTPATLVYGTGGVAWQHFEFTSSCVSDDCAFLGLTPAVVTNSTTKAGWTLGGGIEMVLWGPWIARGEYRYADFGSQSFTNARTASKPNFNPTIDTFDVTMRTHTVTFGVGYKFE